MLESIDRYLVGRELGRGGMAAVYLGYDPRLERDVAIKVMSSTLMEDDVYRKRFKREVKTIAALDHPHIVPVYDYGVTGKQPYLVMRYMAGGSLADRLQSGPLSLAETVVVLRRIGEALDDAHGRGVIHRDLKPANILLDQYGKAFLSDFGIVKMVDAKATPTDPEALTGTPSYMSPEQIQGNRLLDGRSDIYSVGAMLFELLTGHRPYVAEGIMAVALKHLTEPVPSILEHNPGLPEQIDGMIARAMSKKPEDRYATVGEMAAELAIAAGEPLMILDVDTPVVPRSAVLRSGIGSPYSRPVTPSHQPAPISILRHQGVVIGGLVALTLCGTTMLAALGWQVARGLAAAQPTPTIETLSRPANPARGGGTGRIAFVSDMGGMQDIFILDIATKSVRRLLTGIPNKSDPSWSPDGQSLVFQSHTEGQNILYITHADGSSPQPLLQETTPSDTPVWSPDGLTIAFASLRGGSPDIYAMNVDDGDILRLTQTSRNFKPAWSPDGTQIVFYSGRDGDYNIYRMNADGSSPVALTDSPAQDYDPVWSPDGKWIAFVSERDGNPEIYVMDADGTDQTRLTRNDSADLSPAWSPDGSLIVFVSRRDGNTEIYLMSSDGSGQQRLTDSPADDTYPVWQPAVTPE